MITLNYTDPQTEVINEASRILDIETLESEDLDYTLNLKVAQTSKVSISYDIQKMDEMKGGEFMALVKMYLDDPELLLL